MKASRWMRLLLLMAMANGTWTMTNGQVIINGNVYGGGNLGDVSDSTKVTVRACTVRENVFGGARMADVGGRSFVNIDGEHTAGGSILIKTVYGGNDIAGTVGTKVNPNSNRMDSIPFVLRSGLVPSGQTKAQNPGKDSINNSWNAFVRSSKMENEDSIHRIVIGRLFGGGNGDYVYSTEANADGDYLVKDAAGDTIAISKTPFTKPTLAKAYLQLNGGCIAHVYGGGNNATVTSNTTICMNNSSKGLEELMNPANLHGEFATLASFLDLSTFQGNYSSYNYTSSRVFGGNNKATMTIRPTWNIQQGKIRDIYSGGNEGNMTSTDGLILDINPLEANRPNLSIVNVYGGCRRADVHPDVTDLCSVQLPVALGYQFPPGFSARTIVRGGHIENIYGGNDISGRVFGGNAVGIYTTIYGDVYGGGNGSYSYTDNAVLGTNINYQDYYYNPDSVLAKERLYNDPAFAYSSSDSIVQSVEALNIFRPNAEQVSIRVSGESASNPTYIKGSVYLGGNSATLKTAKNSCASATGATVELKIGSNVLCHNVFLGNNGANMVTEEILHRYAGYLDANGNTVDTGTDDNNFSKMDLTRDSIFAKYMEGCAMDLKPSVVFDNTDNGDPDTYIDYSSIFGSFYCGGNRGSMTWPGTNTINFDKKVIIANKFVGGCNNANIAKTAYNAEYLGGMIGSAQEQLPGGMENPDGTIKDCLIFNLTGLRIEPRRWVDEDDPTQGIEWNTIDENGNAVDAPAITGEINRTANPDEFNRRLKNGNIYGGCYESGHINGNVVINLLDNIIDKERIFDVVQKKNDLRYGNDTVTIVTRNSGVLLDEQGMDPLGMALNVFGGGYGPASEVWGSATVNLRSGHTFQIFGGGQLGPIGKSRENNGETPQAGDYEFYGKHYKYDARYSTYVNMEDDDHIAGSPTADIPEIEFIYGGSFEAPIMGNTHVYLGNGRLFNSFAGSCNADILGHTETYVGKSINRDGGPTDGQMMDAFPYIIDHIYGGNDLGGRILGEIRAEVASPTADALEAKADCDFTQRLTDNGQDLTKVYRYDADNNANPSVLTASSYIEYTRGHVVKIFGGAYGDYDYTAEKYRDYCDEYGRNKGGFTKPRLGNAFVNFKPASSNNALNAASEVYGAGQGQHYVIDRDSMQERSYILVDIPQNMTQYENSVFFGAGAYGGVGMAMDSATVAQNPDRATAVIDLLRGQISNVYGGSYKEGVTRRTVVNVPAGSTINPNNIFGGAYGIDLLYPCDVYEAIVNYGSGDAEVKGSVYGGNNNARRTLYGQVNISSPVWTNKAKEYTANVYGAGYGADTWSQYTEVNLEAGTNIYGVYGGGEAGKVLNAASVNKWKATRPELDLRIGSDYTDCGLENALARYSQLALDIESGQLRTTTTKQKYNTNVSIKEGAYVSGYCYGAGLGIDATVSGTSYIDLLGGSVKKDIYGAGTSGAVEDLFATKQFIASANVYIKGGTARNVYGGGWEGSVGHHDTRYTDTTGDILGETHVVIGNLEGSSFTDGVPTVQRNAYGAGEGGAVFGTANISVNNGYIGYAYDSDTGTYKDKIADETYDDGNGYGNNQRLLLAGNVFGSGYADYSDADSTNVYIYGGFMRNSVYGGGEIGTVGRGQNDGSNVTIFKGGATHVYMYDGLVRQNVFGGGRGIDNLSRMSEKGTSGYIFGSTDVNILGGTVGTKEGVTEGYGNVFGGGNLGFVYSAKGEKSDADGYYYDKTTHRLTEDCRVIVAPACQVTSADAITLNGHTYNTGDYVPAEDLNFLKNKKASASQWNQLDTKGIIIHNAIFAGGNVSTGSDQVYANAVTVFGNATATLYDIYNRDLITIGTEHVGGLYGDGNLTFVGGYRELNVSNYGTDYYGMSDNITLEEYNKLTDRERAYFELKYKCISAYTSEILKHTYALNESITEDDYNILDAEEKAHWELNGFCTIYAGRLLNTLQRADFVGVFGSRMVLQGAQDRVPEVMDYTNYTINRVGELSLNKCTSQASDTDEGASHGCYFGIYNIVNYLGALTSDVDFHDVRTTDNTDPGYAADGTTTYYEWKEANVNQRKRNNGTSENKVALASGVFLELVSEESTKDNKIWGPITGVCQLDLINVMTGQGGGYVYAKNEHGVRQESGNDQTILSPYNLAGYGHEKAITNKKYTYNSNLQPFETSGNFIHNIKQIIDDCYPIGGDYMGAAHYWYIKGDIYVYDQYISAFTGTAAAYAESINLPLTITPASNGVLVLEDVKPNLYAYYDNTTEGSKTTIGKDGILLGTNTYHLNDPITYWDWKLLTTEDQKHFVSETYVTTSACTLDNGTEIPEGKVMLYNEYINYKNANDSVMAPKLDANKKVAFDKVFHMTNNLSHTTGYALTYDMTNPKVWDRYYTPITGASIGNKLTTQAYAAASNKDAYLAAPTYTPTTDGVFGQHDYAEGDIIPNDVHTVYETLKTNHSSDLPSGQATVVRAYVATDEVVYTSSEGGSQTERRVNKGFTISETEWNSLDAATKAKFAPANICTNTIELGNNNYVFYGDKISDADVAAYKATYKTYLMSLGISETDADTQVEADFSSSVSKAWYCTTAGKYGGDWYEQSKNYRAIDAWSSLSPEDRQHFTFNYDALDVLIDPAYSGDTELYDGIDSNDNLLQTLYSDQTLIDYTATYYGSEPLTYTDEDGVTSSTISQGDILDRDAYQDIPNEKRYYQPIRVDSTGTYHIVKVAFTRGDTPHTIGTVISEELYNSLDSHQKDNVMSKEFTTTGTYYVCRKAYHVNEKGESQAFYDIDSISHAVDSEVLVGTIIDDTTYGYLPNKQINFTVHGEMPIGTSSLYVARESEINDLTKDKVITVIYNYTYEESDASANHIEEITEKHVINIHLSFKSGVPTIGELQKPATVLPNSTVGLTQPTVQPGAFQLIGGGWELFTNQTDADHHTNGVPYYNNITPVYWYQNNYYVAYYAKSYLGKTYSNTVQISVANYHDLDAVMNHPYHMYVDNKNVERDPKIYIDNRECASDPNKSELDLLKDFFELTLHNDMDEDGKPTTINDASSPVNGHNTVNAQIKGGNNLQFFLNSDVSPEAYTTWDPIGDDTQCFEGVLHGNGYTISGLSNSLFGTLCGDVYNLGVTGSFTTAGIADKGSGYVENSWIWTTGTPAPGVHPVLNNPTREGSTGLKQIVNCYYPTENAYTDFDDDSHGKPTAKPLSAFYNGEVAYDLNGFYLNKRYNDHQSHASTDYRYKYLDENELDSNNKPTLKDGQYSDEADYTLGYVEDYYADGDFIYARGYIPEGENERYVTSQGKHLPIWPDDYLFFGQRLTYDYVSGRPHQEWPTHINKVNTRLTSVSADANRVYRAPAYFQSKEMGVAHYNPYAVFAAHKNGEPTRLAYQGMTAIDFTGGNGDLSGGYKNGLQADGKFYPPLLDNDGIDALRNAGITKNWLVYTPAATGGAATKTHDVVVDYLSEPAYAETNATYRTVAAQDIQSVHGHAVIINTDGTYAAHIDHLLIDKNDFNAPMRYTFDSDKRMWYQREPDTYVDLTKGWDGISLPFSAELVTTQRKGEITHFYGGSEESKNDTHTKLGHEYWLREFKGNLQLKSGETNVYTADFNYPEAITGGEDKAYTNTFLWDYYYQYNSSPRLDNNTDVYQQQYYASAHTHADYAYSEVAKPYIIGFPGATYYEFDLSGQFTAANTQTDVAKLAKQTITFASKPGIAIAISDDELEGAKVTAAGYTFTPNYMSKNVAAGDFLLNAEGSSYKKQTAAVAAVPFRPYFTTAAGARQKRSGGEVEAIAFNQTRSSFGIEERDPSEGATGYLEIYAKKGHIVVESARNVATDVRITNAAGVAVATFTVEPGQTVSTRISATGIYMVNTADGTSKKIRVEGRK